MNDALDFCHAYGRPDSSARFKLRAEDFVVEEELGFDLHGEGEHLWLFVEKTCLTTQEAVKLLSRHSGVAVRDIGYAGLKDKMGVCRQWFSLNTKGRKFPELTDFCTTGLRILAHGYNRKKIRRGMHRGNRFYIRLRHLAHGHSNLDGRLETLSASGVPNYFGLQRFGRGNQNLLQAEQWFQGEADIKGRFLRGMLLSAARAWLFNDYLSARVAASSWNRGLEGDVMNLDGTASFFMAETMDDDLQRRLRELDIHPTGPLWGQGDPVSGAEVYRMELGLRERFPLFCRGLEGAGLQQERRPLRLRVKDLQWQTQEDELILEFRLGKGAYATTVLREIVNIDPS